MIVFKTLVMFRELFTITFLLSFVPICWTLGFDEGFVGWNLNENPNAQNPLDYSGAWSDHDFFPSPQNWRFPFYAITLDRQV